MSSGNLFHSAVDAIFQNWTALQSAVHQGAAGPESVDIAKWMVSATEQWFNENKNLEYDEVEDFLTDIVNQEFNFIIDDGSVTKTSKLVCDFYRLCSSSKEDWEAEFKRRLQVLPKCDLSKCIVDKGEETLEVVDEEENIEQITAATAAWLINTFIEKKYDLHLLFQENIKVYWVDTISWWFGFSVYKKSFVKLGHTGYKPLNLH